MPQQHERLDYIEFPATDLGATRAFYQSVFGWQFIDYGPEYTAFSAGSAGIDGGFTTLSDVGKGTLAVLYSDDIEATLAKVMAAGAPIVKELFEFPGGRRFHFLDPSGNELAVWSVPADGGAA